MLKAIKTALYFERCAAFETGVHDRCQRACVPGTNYALTNYAPAERLHDSTQHHINEHNREKLLTANENRASWTAIRELENNEMNVQQLRQCEWIIKRGHFRAAEY